MIPKNLNKPEDMVIFMNTELVDKLRRETDEIVSKIKETSNQNIDSQIETLERQGYTVGSTDPLCVYGSKYDVKGVSLIPFVESKDSESRCAIELRYRYKPASYKAKDLLKIGNLPLTEDVRIEREYDLKEIIFGVSGLYFSIRDDEVVLSQDLELGRFNESLKTFKKSVERAKAYLRRMSNEKRSA
jgi:hypothetical protein